MSRSTTIFKPRSTSCDVLISLCWDEYNKQFAIKLSKSILSHGLNYSFWDWNPRGPLEEFRVYVVFFTKAYASSKSHLQNLAAILAECIYSPAHTFLPVLFVDPSVVRSSCFLKLMQEFGLEDSDKVVTLMNRRPDLVVRHPRNLQRVFNTIYKELDISSRQNSWPSRRSQNFIYSIVQKIDKSDQIAPVGIRYNRVEEVIRLLDLGSKDVVRVIGISGMGGVGKTALAGDVFHKISHSFDYTCFLTDVTDSLLSEVLRAALQEEYVDEYNIDGRLRYHRMLIVFDDVEDVDKLVHFRHLTRIRTWLGGGSRIIIISRDQHVLKMLGVDEIHKVELLNKNEALRLFCQTVFNSRYPLRGYEDLTLDALKYADGLPLAIKSVGSLLQNRSFSEWQNELAKLQVVPDSSVLKVLQKSFDGLGWNEKTIFLDIECCFAGQNINYVQQILSNRGQLVMLFRTYLSFDVEPIIRVLIDKSLVSIVHKKIEMHSLLQKMGKEIVRQESKDPGKRSRIWCYEDFRHIMETSTGTEDIEVIVLLNEEYPLEAPLNAEGLSKMSNLRVAIFYNVNFSGSLNGDRRLLSLHLGYLSWHRYPFAFLPAYFEANELEHLILEDSCITQLTRDDKKIRMWGLRSLNLSGSKNFEKAPDFERLPKLERVDFEGCTSLLQLDPIISSLKSLQYLNLRNCTNLVSIPNELFGKSSLEFLNLAGCSKFAECLSFNKRLNTLPPILV